MGRRGVQAWKLRVMFACQAHALAAECGRDGEGVVVWRWQGGKVLNAVVEELVC
jgi:hypothetical protein